jgi:hypothetical protein
MKICQELNENFHNFYGQKYDDIKQWSEISAISTAEDACLFAC